jgi:transcriptional regulator with XRE-family HTH domain
MPEYPSKLPKGRRSGQTGVPFGQRIRALRKAARLTLENLSAASGISRAALSKIERGEMSPTYESLLRLARGLGTDLATLVSGRQPAGGGYDVTRGGKGAEHRAGRFVHQLLAPDLSERALFAFVTEVRVARLEDYDSWDRHESEDFLYVLEGAVAVHLADRAPIELRRGDSMQMDGRIPHALVALPSGGKKPAQKPVARLLWVSVPFA